MTSAQYTLWLLQPVLNAAIVAVMIRKKLHRRYPILFSYTLYSIVATLLLFMLRTSYQAYFYAYWSTHAIACMLLLGIIYELFTELFRKHHALRDFGNMLFGWSIAVVAIMATMLLLSTKPVGGNPVVASIMNLDRSITMLQCGMLLFLLLFSSHLKIEWKHQIFGITLALGMNAALELILASQWIHALFPSKAYNLLHMSAWDWTLLTWLVYMLLPVPADAVPNLLLRPQRWNEALQDAAHPANGPVLLGIEDIVERTLKNKVQPIRTA